MGKIKNLINRAVPNKALMPVVKREPSAQHNTITYSDQTQCRICGKVWDTNDAEPPECDGPK